MTRTPAERQAEYRKRRQATGLKALTLWLPPEAARVLESYPKEQRDGIAAQAILTFNSNVTVANSNGIHPALEALTRRVEALESALTLHNSDVTKTEHKAKPREPELETGKLTDEAACVTGDSTRKLTDKVADTRAPQASAKLPPKRIPILIRQARNLHTQGLTWAGIAEQWNAKGVPTVSGTGQWHGATVAKLVANR